MNITIDPEFVVAKLTDLVQINSVNPKLVHRAPGEALIGKYIFDTLEECGIQSNLYVIEPGRVNVIGRIRGSGGGKTLMLNGHMDTVGVAGMHDPFSAEIRDGKLYGRGAQDMKGSIAAMLAAIKALKESGTELKGDIIFAGVADEEFGSIGTEALLQYHSADAAIVTEPTGLDLCLAHRGYCVFEIKTHGRAAHGGSPDDGIDAICHMGRVLHELDTLSRELRERDPHPLVGTPSMHVPLIQGGTQQFIYADECSVSLERRTVPGETLESAEKEIDDIVKKLSDNDERFRAECRAIMHRDPFEISPEKEIVKTVGNCIKQVTGKTPEITGHSWWEDSGLMGEAGIDTVIVGPRGSGLHSHEEWVDIQSVIDLAGVLALSAVEYSS
ncbi:ArgE/DapE family deacylase [candidate division KSB1 bacterium]